ncbi:hypothetical protein CFE70_006857 [Pyrenophora teres f. teres 0-1]|uniref:Radical SAM core domain-containing protein n=2 Tax=Pyrenophora teres f. teres TaxID=97479 RepID=E3SAC2_PYRTT|nr:hypothetical protein PTT_20080 [Pyrenophora teres f. teres 0-1]KAE8826519.1 hypothetical protein HRS9122_10021 [Pyrenophora teres f. teres]CAA9963431.1 radical s-adenosyl methionine domain-containing protein [Pyrenophora teres f. maculata]KAE8828472.1 hypothetical protein HRS9139_07691 [Pyrenophora teres f. teres]KAE8831073.1 hypothetical protein PTNB85_07660 [Pyrenophora teres f. teres]
MVLLSLLAEVPVPLYILAIGLCTVYVYTTFAKIGKPMADDAAIDRSFKPMVGKSVTPAVTELTKPSIEEVAVSTVEIASKSPAKEVAPRLDPSQQPDAPVSVNYFPSRVCNYACRFCFHTAKTSYMLNDYKIKRGLKMLKEAGMRKLNIAGGEPFLHPKKLTMMLEYCKEELGVESISIVSNGDLIREKWMRENAKWLDILAISCDSFNAATNITIGRGEDGENVRRLREIAAWCRTYNVKFKLNTVVNKYNWNEDMVAEIQELAPFRWKVFQCLIVAGENESKERLRDARDFLVTDEQWRTFCDRHKHLPCYVPEDNNSMASSYLLLDEYMRFLDKGEGMIKQSESLLEVGVMKAMEQVVWDKKSFVERGGIYDWGREDGKQKEMGSACGTTLDLKALEY